jgi:two-component system KDP operon response regulator KdpE
LAREREWRHKPVPGPPQAAILVVDDEPAIRRTLHINLTGHGYHVLTATTARDALAQLDHHHPDLVVLDLGLPDLDGLEVVRRIRARSQVPVIILTVRGIERDKIAALDLGADDYLTKPFGVGELLARIRVALRHAPRSSGDRPPVYRSGDLVVDLERRTVRVGGADAHLTPTEFALLSALVGSPGRVMTDGMLLKAVWGPQYGDETHYLHVYVARLRKKLEVDPQRPRYITTEPGVGYRLLADEPAEL